MRKGVIIMLCVAALSGCSGGSSSDSGEAGNIALQLEEAQAFDPNAVHGEIAEYRVTIAGDDLSADRIQVYPAGTEQASIEALPAGAHVLVEVEYINVNGLTVRHGESETVEIRGGTTTSVTVQVNNVPIFANVRDGATVRADRFVPSVFAPGGIEFVLKDRFAGEVSRLTDQTTGELSFSVSEDESSLRRVAIPELSPGQHELTVEDVSTGEATRIAVTIIAGTDTPVLITTSGGLTGLPMGGSFNLAEYVLRATIE